MRTRSHRFLLAAIVLPFVGCEVGGTSACGEYSCSAIDTAQTFAASTMIDSVREDQAARYVGFGSTGRPEVARATVGVLSEVDACVRSDVYSAEVVENLNTPGSIHLVLWAACWRSADARPIAAVRFDLKRQVRDTSEDLVIAGIMALDGTGADGRTDPGAVFVAPAAWSPSVANVRAASYLG